jgi:uncharacterized membrane protein
MDAEFPSQNLDFRRRLKRELAHWHTRRLIDDAQHEQLCALYHLDQVNEPAQRSIAGTILTFGMLLVGLGVITLVAANWLLFPAAVKVVVLLGALWGAYGGGWWLWQVQRSAPLLGRGLVFCGSLIYGANLALFGQIFQIDGDAYQLLFAWAIGILAVAWAIGGVPEALLALVVAGFGYLDWAEHLWQLDRQSLLVPLAPWIGLALFAPLAWRLAQRWLYELVVLAFAGFVWGDALSHGNPFTASSSLPLLVLAVLLALWSWVAGHLAPMSDGWNWNGRPLLAGLAAFAVGTLAYTCAFWGAAESLASEGGKTIAWAAFFSSPTVLLLLVTLTAGAVQLWRSPVRPASTEVAALAVAVGGVLLPVALHLPPLLTVLWNNFALIGLGAYLVWNGLRTVARRDFLLGQGLIAWMILSRFFEYDTGLLVKALAFIVAGAAVIGFALWFEKHLTRRGALQDG